MAGIVEAGLQAITLRSLGAWFFLRLLVLSEAFGSCYGFWFLLWLLVLAMALGSCYGSGGSVWGKPPGLILGTPEIGRGACPKR